MEYRELAPPSSLAHLIKVGWTLAGGGGQRDRVTHVATQDGCMEVIRRLSGHSAWGGEQPECFVAGLIDQPASLDLSGDASFLGVRLWPWAWNALGKVQSPQLVNRWADLGEAAPGLALPADADEMMSLVANAAARSVEPDPLHVAILASRSVAELAQRSGRSHRALQRWFEREVGVPPRKYLRLLRFSETVQGLPATGGSLAGHAAQHGFADQAHMAREFRSLAGAPAAKVRKAARGPFLPRSA